MKKAGCRRLHVGFEAGTDRVLKLMNKKITTEDSIKAAARIHKYGIEIVGYFIIGYPGETLEESEETIKFACSLPIEFVQAAVFTPTIGSKVYIDSVNEGLYPDFYREYNKNPINFEDFYYNDDLVPREVKKKLVSKTYKKFYFSFKHIYLILKTLKTYPRIKHFISAAKIAFLGGGLNV